MYKELRTFFKVIIDQTNFIVLTHRDSKQNGDNYYKKTSYPLFVKLKPLFFQKMSNSYVRPQQSEVNTLPSTDRRKSVLRASPKKNKSNQQTRQPPRCRLFYQDEDVTPLPLNPYIFEDVSEKQLSVYDLSDTGLGQTRSEKEVNIFGQQQHLSQFASQIYNQSITDTSGFMQSHITGYFDDVSIDDYATSEFSVRTVQSLASTESQLQPKSRAPTHVSLSLVETETFFILELPSSTAIKDTDEGAKDY